jgi:hypothetical protein
VLYTGPRASHIDLVFYADEDSYTGSSDPAFLGDVLNAIENGYYGQDIYLANQDKINFWISGATAKAEPDCDTEAPQKAWEDAGAVFHTDNFRDCSPGGERVFSTIATRLDIMRHETGHRPFGLADEYCCDGGYFQSDPFPNAYEEDSTCKTEAPLLGRTEADCRSWVEDIPWWFDDTWWTSDPPNRDIMVDNTVRRALDNRRMNWLFDVCRGAGC